MVPVVVMWFRWFVTGRASRRAGSQDGFTLVELLVGMFIGGLVIATAAVVLSFVLGQNRRSSASISDSNSAFRTGNTFADDVQSASPVPGFSDPVTVGADGCGASASLVRLAGIEPDGNVLVRSYHRVVDGDRVKLVRRQCSGATLAAALAAPATFKVVVVDLDPGGSAVSVTCDGGRLGAGTPGGTGAPGVPGGGTGGTWLVGGMPDGFHELDISLPSSDRDSIHGIHRSLEIGAWA